MSSKLLPKCCFCFKIYFTGIQDYDIKIVLLLIDKDVEGTNQKRQCSVVILVFLRV